MAEPLRFLPVGSDGLLVELNDLQTTLSLLDALQGDRPDGVIELIPAARTLMIHFNTHITNIASLVETIAHINLSTKSRPLGEVFEIPVTYDGEDLNDVAELLGLSVEDLIRRHTEATYIVAFTGFAPGFAYMTADDPLFDVPRRKSPRVSIPTGSVALGGKFGGIYPTNSPGGWQLIGRTELRMWDANRPRAAFLAPGDRVRFCDTAKGVSVPVSTKPAVSKTCIHTPKISKGLIVTRADRPAFFQDLGRSGYVDQGVSQSGALDRRSLVEANLCVGNPRGSTAIEVAYGGFAMRAERPMTMVVTGAPAQTTIHTPDGRSLTLQIGQPFALNTGDELLLEFPREGTRSYIAARGGFIVEKVLGSAATDTLAEVGPAPIVVGDILMSANEAISAVSPDLPCTRKLPKAGDTIMLDIILGPRTDWFTSRSLTMLLTQEWQVTPESSRIGIRLTGQVPLQRVDAAELPSEGTLLGAIQVPHNGQPVLFLADHPLTGGYPVIGVVTSYHHDLVGQIPIGAKIRFNAVPGFEPISRGNTR